MRIDELTTAAHLRSLYAIDLARQSTGVGPIRTEVTADGGGSTSDSSARERTTTVAVQARRRGQQKQTSGVSEQTAVSSDSAALSSEPRFAVLIELMERLTGREITLLPPATITLGARKEPAANQSPPPAAQTHAHVNGVRPIGDDRSFRVHASATDNGKDVATTQFDVSMDVIQNHAHRSDPRSGPLAVHVSQEAILSSRSAPLRIENSGPDAVRVTPTQTSTSWEA